MSNAGAKVRTGLPYVHVWQKFTVSFCLALIWLTVGVVLSLPWLNELAGHITFWLALIAIALVAYIPGHLMSFMFFSLLLDRQPPMTVDRPTDEVTVVIAARNEVNAIGSTIDYLMAQDYAGPIRVILADNNSTDNTVDVARQAAREVGMNLTVVHESLPGKSNALNTALRIVETDLVLTLDADTELHDQALRRLVSRKRSSPGDVVAVAGSILVANEDQSFWSRMQGWDYFLAIASIKRMQGLYSSTLVAQGAFSIYETARLREVGGWPDSIGEDIVVTWRLLDNGGRVTFEPTAVAFTDVPVTLRHLIAQRSRWARGMVEAIHAVKPWSQPRGLTGAITAIDLAIPWLDLGYTFVWIPGLVLACFGIFWIVGLWTLLVFPVTLLIYASLAHFQNRHVVKPLNLDIRHSWFGLVTFLLVFQLVMSPVSIWGYLQEIFGMRRRWR